MDAGESGRTPADGIIRESIRWRPPASTGFRLPLLRNRQVVGSSPTAGSNSSRFVPVTRVTRSFRLGHAAAAPVGHARPERIILSRTAHNSSLHRVDGRSRTPVFVTIMRAGCPAQLLSLLISISIAPLTATVGDADGTAAITETGPLALTVRVRDTAHVPGDVLAQAQGDVTRIYRQASVDLVWATPESLCATSNTARHTELTIALLSFEQGGRIDSGVTTDRVGFAARDAAGDGRVAYVLYDRIDVLAEANGWDPARMLAIAMAHEIGHLLLPYDAHSLDGVMRGDWTNEDIQLAQRSLLFFSAKERDLLRSRIVTLRGEWRHKSVCRDHSRLR